MQEIWIHTSHGGQSEGKESYKEEHKAEDCWGLHQQEDWRESVYH
jgi:hypothetical protein